MTTLRPCLWLSPDEADAAVELYQRVVPGTRLASTTHVNNADQPDRGVDIHQLEVGDVRLQIMSSLGRPADFTEAVSLYLVVDDQAALDRVWDGFVAAGGREVACGWVHDPYGVRWQVVPRVFHDLVDAGDPAQAQRVVEAVWGMVRIDAAALAAAARG